MFDLHQQTPQKKPILTHVHCNINSNFPNWENSNQCLICVSVAINNSLIINSPFGSSTRSLKNDIMRRRLWREHGTHYLQEHIPFSWDHPRPLLQQPIRDQTLTRDPPLTVLSGRPEHSSQTNYYCVPAS